MTKKLTYPQARVQLFAYLRSRGWEVRDRLKVPRAFSPDRDVEVWFKAQAVHAAPRGGRPYSIWIDIRTTPPEMVEAALLREARRSY